MWKNNFKKPIVFLSIVFALIYTLFPFLYMVSVSFKVKKEIFAMPPKYFNFFTLFTFTPIIVRVLLQILKNSYYMHFFAYRKRI